MKPPSGPSLGNQSEVPVIKFSSGRRLDRPRAAPYISGRLEGRGIPSERERGCFQAIGSLSPPARLAAAEFLPRTYVIMVGKTPNIIGIRAALEQFRSD